MRATVRAMRVMRAVRAMRVTRVHANHSANVKNFYLFCLHSHENILDEFFFLFFVFRFCYLVKMLSKECVHDGHVGGPKQYNDFPFVTQVKK